MSDFDDLLRLVLKQNHRIAELEYKLANFAQLGPVEETDAKKGYRLNLGKDNQGKTVLSPWYPHPEAGGKKHKTWKPLTKGEIMMAINPSGDPRQGFLIRAGFSDQKGFKQPSENLDEVVEENFRDGDNVQRKVTIDKDGNKSETLKGKNTVSVEKDQAVTIKGKSDVTVEQDQTVTVKGSRTVKVTGLTTYETGGINWT